MSHSLQGNAGSTSSPYSAPSDTQFTELFAKLNAGDPAARDELISKHYSDLKAIAHRLLKKNAHGTMCTTVLADDFCLKVLKGGKGSWEHRRHFLATAAMAMRQLIVDYVRSKKAKKRLGNRVPLDDFIDTRAKSADILALDEALKQLALIDEELVKVVEMRFFAGYTIRETARILHTSPRTVVRHWKTASAWLYCQLKATG